MGHGSKARVKAVRRTTFMQVVPTERPTFVQALAPERLIPFEATAGGNCNSQGDRPVAAVVRSSRTACTR